MKYVVLILFFLVFMSCAAQPNIYDYVVVTLKTGEVVDD